MTVENIGVNMISFGPCWCNGDTSTGGHQHASSDGGNLPEEEMTARSFPHSIYGNSSAHTERKAIFGVLIEIRDLLAALTEEGE